MPAVYVPDPVLVTLQQHTCGTCGIIYAMPEDHIARRKQDHEAFYCPNGHGRSFTGKNEAELLREQLAAKDREIAAVRSRVDTLRNNLDTERESHSATVRSLRATKAVVTRTKKKIVAGRCPCCSTKFKDLAVHMRTEHPNYDPEKAAAALEAKS